MMGTVLIAGDLFPTAENLALFTRGDVDALFGEKLAGLFAQADYTLCNLEGALTDRPEKARKTGPVKIAPAASLAAVQKLGIDCCLLANNHVTDAGGQGVVDTIRILEEAGIASIGAGSCAGEIQRFIVREIGGLRLGFYNVSETMYNKPGASNPGVWLYDEYVVCRELVEAKAKCDYLTVLYHGGIEKFPYPSPETRKRFHRMADSGADLVIAQHTHCIGCEEIYNGATLIYGQGDFLLRNFAPGLTDSGLLVELVVDGGKVVVRKHLVRSVDNLYVHYADVQDLSAYEARSAKVGDEAFVYRELQKFCAGELPLYLTAFKSPNKFWRQVRRFCPKLYRKWLYRYRERDLMFALHTLRSEQNRETAIVGIEDLLKL